MCGRFTLATPSEVLAALFEVDAADWNEARYNIAPQVRMVTVRTRNGKRAAQSLRWGAVNPRGPGLLINARAETVAASPMFARAFASARVLVPADGFFEWTTEGARRQGRYFQMPGGGPFAFAGIAVTPREADESSEPAAVILTTAASESVKTWHDRMPVIVRPDAFGRWLEERATARAALDLLANAAEAIWTSHAVGPAVNNVRNDSAENVRPAGPFPSPQRSLF